MNTTSNDPALTLASERVDGIVHPRYDHWYAGVILDHAAETLTIYRKPGSDLDRVIRAQVTGVPVVFKMARLSEKEMLALVQKIIADTSYWKGRGITVNGAGPLPDGSGVSVLTTAGTQQESAMMSRYYGDRVVAERGSAVLAPGSKLTPTPSNTRPG